jgi:hypothetical protein
MRNGKGGAFMLVIEGRSKKSVRVNELLEDFNDKKILIVDTVNSTKWWGKDNSVVTMGIEDMKKQLSSIKSLILIEKYDIVVFYSNDKKENLAWYVEAEKTIRKPVIVTIQNNELHNIREYTVKEVES